MNNKDLLIKQSREEITELRKENIQLKKGRKKQAARLEKLRSSESKYRLLLKNAPAIIVNIDLTGKILYVNHTIPGITVKDVLGSNIYDNLRPVEQENLRRITKSVSETGKKEKHEAPFFSPEGKIYWYSNEYAPIKINGKIVELVITASDITIRKKAELSLKESEEKFRTLAEKSPNMIFIISKGRIIYANKMCEDVTGYTITDLSGPDFNFLEMIDSVSGEKLIELNTQRKKGKDFSPYDNSLFTKDGERIDVIITTKLIQYEGETAILGVATDITKRKKAEQALIKSYDELEQRVTERTAELMKTNMQMSQEIDERKRVEKALRESEEKLRSILDASPDAITVADLDGIITDCNQAALDQLGLPTKPELIGKSVFTPLAPKERKRAKQEMKKVLKRGVSKSIEYTFQRQNKSIFPAEESAGVIKDTSGNPAGFVWITKDISIRKKAEKALIESESELRKQKRTLEEKNIALREIIAQIEIEKRKIEEDIETNVNLVVSPILDKLRSFESTRNYVHLLKYHLKGLTSSFGSKITAKDINLTPREFEICNMIKGSMTSKDIAKMLNISCQTVERHRKNIRHKLGIANRRINLTSYLRKI